MTKSEFKSGFITIAGAPNAGKSTLLNTILGEKISIISEKPQTTRNRILGILNQPDFQMVFIDTPGIHVSNSLLNMRMIDQALSSFAEVDIILLLADIKTPDPTSEDIILKNLVNINKPVILALNKIDLVKKHTLLELIDTWQQRYAFHSIIPISAIEGTQVEDLLKELSLLLPDTNRYYPEDMRTDLTNTFMIAECIREKVFILTHQDIPYAIAVTVDHYERKGKIIHISASIHVERDSQKGIIIGKDGQKLKRIGEQARKEIEEMLHQQVFLKLFVRVQKNWRKDTKALRRFGY
ncbi:MAG: GTPase Era [Desulfobacterales bacterium]|nr:GTPase Era [Desulfobacterales bacterium]